MILVTGGTGLLGANLLKRLVQHGEEPRALFRSRKSIDSNPVLNGIRDKVVWVKADILDISSVREALTDITKVYHCAGLVSLNKADVQKLIDINIKGTRNVVDAILETRGIKLLHVSSVAALSKSDSRDAFTEGVPWEGPGKKSSAYNRSKYLAECEVWRGVEEGLNAVIINPSVILGLGPDNHSSASIFYKIWRGLPFYSPGSTGFVTAEDCVNAMTTLMDSDLSARRYLLSSSNVKFKVVFQEIAKNLERKAPQIMPPRWMSDLACKIGRVQSLFGFTPFITSDAVDAAYRDKVFDGSKITRDTSFTYEPFFEGVERVSTEYKTILS